LKDDCSGWCDLNLNGFKWHSVDQQGIGAKIGYDMNSQDLYSISGDTFAGQIILSNYPGDEENPTFHMKKSEGHATDQVDMDLCQLNPDKCQDATLIDYTIDPNTNTFEKIRMVDKYGVAYVFEPTAKFVKPSGEAFALMTKKSNFPTTSCFPTHEYTETRYLKNFSYEFGLTEIQGANYVDYNGNGYVDENDKGNWVKFNYNKWTDDFRKVSPYDGTCIESPDGTKVYTESFHELSYLDTIETPTHVAQFSVDYARLDQKESGGSRNLPRYTKVKLFSKQDLGLAIETHVFDYVHNLAKGTPDSTEGKLTLQSITKKDNTETQSLPPVMFDYDGDGDIFCGNSVCDSGEDCISCHQDCECFDYDDWYHGYIMQSSYTNFNCGSTVDPTEVPEDIYEWNVYNNPNFVSYYYESDDVELIDGDAGVCGQGVYWGFITWIWVGEDYTKTLNLNWDDDYFVRVWNNIGEQFDGSNAQTHRYCNNGVGTANWGAQFTRGWNVIQVALLNDGGQCRAYYENSIDEILSNDDKIWYMNGQGAYLSAVSLAMPENDPEQSSPESQTLFPQNMSPSPS